MWGNLPLHPMVVHFAVVFILVTAVAQLAVVVSARFRAWIGWVLPALAVLSAVTAKVAESFGEILERHSDRTQAIHEHAELGEKAALFAIVLAVLAIAYWLTTSTRLPAALDRRVGVLRRRPVVLVVAVLAALAAIAAIVFDVLAGHSGAVAVWRN